tara:strand:- start:2891 stop:3313 length:423 start_codon:yes stop_codon:yes gene_type:complete
MELRIQKAESDKIVQLFRTVVDIDPDCSQRLVDVGKKAKLGVRVLIDPIVAERTRRQEGYYRKWAREFGRFCGMTPDEIHEELLCVTYGSVEVETKFGVRRRPQKRSGETNRISYSELIDTLIRVSSEMGFNVPPAERCG